MQNRYKPVAGIRAPAFTKIAALPPVLLMASFFVAMSFSPAQAESRTCKRLERQLASLSSGGGSSSSRIYRAIRNQQKQIGIAKRRLRRLGCAKRRLFFFTDSHASCGRLRGTLQQMRNNLAALKASAGQTSRKRSTKRQRSKIQRAMRRHACGVTRTAKRKQQESIADQVFGKKSKKRNKRRLEREKRLAAKQAEDAARVPQHAETVNTMCVRTCDGYFFPVSLSTRRGSPRNGASACENLCPGTEMQLYVHKKFGQDPKHMVSLASGKPYSALPTAFAYQKSFNPNCSCNYRQAAKANNIVAGEEKKQIKSAQRTERRAVQKTAMPIWRPDGAADPETIANRRGKLDLAALGAPNEERPFSQVSQRNVRVIGETFLPSQ